MPVLKNARHEKFAQSFAKGNSATDAYIVARVKELQSAGAERTLVSIDSLTDELEEANV